MTNIFPYWYENHSVIAKHISGVNINKMEDRRARKIKSACYFHREERKRIYIFKLMLIAMLINIHIAHTIC